MAKVERSAFSDEEQTKPGKEVRCHMGKECHATQSEALVKEGSQDGVIGVSSSMTSVGWEAYRLYLEAFVEGNADPATTAAEKTAQMLGKMAASGSFSWCALFFAPAYWGWRRCYWEAATHVCCILVLLPVVAFTGLSVLMTALQIGAGFEFYQLYSRHAMRAYSQTYATYGVDHSAMVSAMRASGGTSWKGLWLTMALYVAVTFLEAFLLVGLMGIG